MEPVPVLHLVPELTPSGRNRGLLDLLACLDRRMFRVRVVAAAEMSADVRAAFESAAVPVGRLPVTPPAGRPLLPRARAHARATGSLRRYLAEARPRIVHTHGPWLNLFGGLAARLARVQHHMSHDHDAPGGGRRERVLLRWAARLPDVAFVDSPRIAEVRRRVLGTGAERVLCLPLGVDLRRFQRATPSERLAARDALGLPPEAYVVGTVGHLLPRKHVDTLVDAMPALLAREPTARLLVCGDGPERERLEARGRELGLDGRLVWCGWRTDPRSVYDALDVFATLAAEPGGACRTLAEAMACGLPAVASRTPLHAEIAGERALLVDVRPRAAAEALVSLARSAAWRHRLGIEAREHAARKLDLDVAVRLLEAAYAHCVGRTPRPWGSRQALPAR